MGPNKVGGRQRANPRRLKIHRTYDVAELARVTGVHRNTVRNWIKQGLKIIDDRRPVLIKGCDAKQFLKDRRQRAKQSCRPDEMFCLGCRTPRKPAGGMADYVPQSERAGMLRGICPVCDRLINKCVSAASLGPISADLEIAFPHGQPSICRRA